VFPILFALGFGVYNGVGASGASADLHPPLSHFTSPALSALSLFSDGYLFAYVAATLFQALSLRARGGVTRRREYRVFLCFLGALLATSLGILSAFLFKNDFIFVAASSAFGVISVIYTVVTARLYDYSHGILPPLGYRRRSLKVRWDGEADATLSLEDLAELLRVSPARLSYHLNVRYGKNFKSYLNARRIERACEELVAHPDRSILDIALSSGFNSKSNFNTLFARSVGLSPREFRRRKAGSPTSPPDAPIEVEYSPAILLKKDGLIMRIRRYQSGIGTLAVLSLCLVLPLLLAACPGAGATVSVRHVYAGGTSKTSAGVVMPGYWKDGDWIELTPGYEGYTTCVRGIAVSGDEVYVGGYCYSGSSPLSLEPCTWKNGVWDALPKQGDTSLANLLYCMAVSDGDLYLGGMSRNDSGYPIPGYWVEDGSTEPEVWHALTPLVSGQFLFSAVRTIAVSGGYVYAGGYSYNSSSVSVPGYWVDDGATNVWHGQTPLDTSKESIVMAIAVEGSDVYAAGYSTNSSGVKAPGYWLNDGAFQELEPLDSSQSCDVETIMVSGGDVYIGGGSTNSSGVMVPGYWKNDEAFTELPQVDSEHSSDVYSMAILEGDVYAGGYSIYADGYLVAGCWLNGDWNELPALSTQDARVYSMVVVER